MKILCFPWTIKRCNFFNDIVLCHGTKFKTIIHESVNLKEVVCNQWVIPLKLVLHDAISCNLSRNAKITACNMPSLQLVPQFSGLATIDDYAKGGRPGAI